MTMALKRRMVEILRSPLFFGALLLALFFSIPDTANAASLSSEQLKITTSGQEVEAAGLSGANLPSSGTAFYSAWLAVLESRDRCRDGADDKADPASGSSNGIDAHLASLPYLAATGSSGGIHFSHYDPARLLSGAYLKIRARAPPAI